VTYEAVLRAIGEWFEARLCLRESLGPMLTQPDPPVRRGTHGLVVTFSAVLR